MTIQLNADRNLSIHEEFRDKLKELLSEELGRFSENITRLEVHLSDENGQKDGLKDKRCVLEARLEGKQPIAVTDEANTYEKAVDGAIYKLKTMLDSKLGRLSNH
ncbi:MAG: HPF/RaiA family ribosome-associated protein [Bacteroidia bacterium]|nr:HPF/RaiA family ribosome-associated protein [Bacteroidia bacterium]